MSHAGCAGVCAALTRPQMKGRRERERLSLIKRVGGSISRHAREPAAAAAFILPDTRSRKTAPLPGLTRPASCPRPQRGSSAQRRRPPVATGAWRCRNRGPARARSGAAGSTDAAPRPDRPSVRGRVRTIRLRAAMGCDGTGATCGVGRAHATQPVHHRRGHIRRVAPTCTPTCSLHPDRYVRYIPTCTPSA